MYVLGWGLYSKILDSKKLEDFWQAEYSLEITLEEKLQTLTRSQGATDSLS